MSNIDRKDLAHALNASHGRPELNSVFVIATCLLFAFWLRDYMALRMSPGCRAARRSVVYGAAILLTAMLIWTLEEKFGIGDLVSRIGARRILFLLIAFHIAESVPSIWVQRTQNYNWMWATALFPAPIVWLLLLKATLLSEHGLGTVGFFALAVLWAGSMAAAILRIRDTQMPPDDLDFTVILGSLSHWLAACAIPLAFSVT